MKKTTLAVTFAFALALISGAKAVQFDYTQFPGLIYTLPIVTILSPSLNEQYNVPDVRLNVTVQIRSSIYACNIERIRWLNYSLDGQDSVPITLIVPPDLVLPYYAHGNAVLTSLSYGNITSQFLEKHLLVI